MSDRIGESQIDERTLEIIEALVGALPDAERDTERRKWEDHFRWEKLLSEKMKGSRGFWWPDSAYGVRLYELDPLEWREVEKSAEGGARRCFGELTGISSETVDLKTLILRLAETGENFENLLPYLLSAEPKTSVPGFLEELAKAAREGNRRRSLPDHKRLFQPGTMRDLASLLLTFRWDRGIRMETFELPPFALWTDQAIADFFRNVIAFPADSQAIGKRRNFYKLKQPSLILVDRIDLERIGGEGEEIEIGERIRIGYCRKERNRKA